MLACKLAPSKVQAFFETGSKKIKDSKACDSSKKSADLSDFIKNCGGMTWKTYFELDQAKALKGRCGAMNAEKRDRAFRTMASCTFESPELGELKISDISESAIGFAASCGEHCAAHVSYFKNQLVRMMIREIYTASKGVNVYCCHDGPKLSDAFETPSGCILRQAEPLTAPVHPTDGGVSIPAK